VLLNSPQFNGTTFRGYPSVVPYTSRKPRSLCLYSKSPDRKVICSLTNNGSRLLEGTPSAEQTTRPPHGPPEVTPAAQENLDHPCPPSAITFARRLQLSGA
jgi:hypothetical protein